MMVQRLYMLVIVGRGLELIMQGLSIHIVVRRVWGILLMSQY
jgi:hypothetical protein